MIKDRLINASRYYGLGANIEATLNFLQESDFSEVPDGRYQLKGKDIYYLVERYDTVPIDGSTEFEAHGIYLDIQYFVSGNEVIPHEFIENLTVKVPFDAEIDGASYHYQSTASHINFTAGDIAFFFPNDAHSPRGAVEGIPSAVNKIVCKVKL